MDNTKKNKQKKNNLINSEIISDKEKKCSLVLKFINTNKTLMRTFLAK